VQAALEADELDPGALANYRKLQGELAQARAVVKQRERQGPRGPKRR